MEQARQDFVVGQLARAPVVAPAVGVGHRLIKGVVGVGKPDRFGVVDVGQDALFQGRCHLGRDGQQAVGVAWHHLGHVRHQIDKVEPVFPQGVLLGGSGRNLDGAGVEGVVTRTFSVVVTF